MGAGPSKPFPYPLSAPGMYHHEPHSQWSVSKGKKSKRSEGYPAYGYQAAPYGYSYYGQIPSRYPPMNTYYAPVPMTVVPPVAVQQPVLAMPQAYVPVVPVHTSAAQSAPSSQMPVPVSAPVPAPVAAPVAPAAVQREPRVRMPEPAVAGQNQGPVIPPIPAGADAAVPPPPILGDAGSTRPRFTDFYRPADPPIAQPGLTAMPNPDVPFRLPTAPPIGASMRGNPLPEPPKDVWSSSPYRQVLANLPNDVGRLFEVETQRRVVLDPPERSSSRPGGLFGSKRDKEKKSTLKNLFRSLSTSSHGHQGSSSRHGHHHSQPAVTSFVVPPPVAGPPPTSMPQPTAPEAPPASPVIPIPQPGPPVRFNHTGEHSGFVNHSPHRVLYRNKMYPTALHLLEAMKFTERPDLAERIRTCADVIDMYPLSASFQQHVRPDWGQVFLKTMDEVLYLKFKQHPNLRALLLRTGLSDIIYADANSYWGEGPQGEGANELGKALVRVREQLRREGER